MRFYFRLFLLLQVMPLALAEQSSNAVNERIPVGKHEMEAHWKVDCTASWASQADLREKSGQPGCALPAKLQQQLELCAFIYQIPGDHTDYAGPDYRGASASGAGQIACRIR